MIFRNYGADRGDLSRPLTNWLWLVLLLVLFPPLSAQPTVTPERSPELTVELVLVESENQARVVDRAMRTGFFIDQLLIPETSYVGRIPWTQLSPGLRDLLENAPHGIPQLLSGADGKHVVARVLPSGPPALLGQIQYSEASEDIWALLSVGPTDARLLSQEIDVDTEDLEAICQSKQRLIDTQLSTARAKVRSLPLEASPQEMVRAYAAFTGVLSLRGELEEAIQELELLAGKLPAPASSGQHRYHDVLDQFLGILQLRRGEVDNCLDHHHREMCLFPLSEAAQHDLDLGAQRAFQHFSSYLKRNPQSLEVRWLLNIAAMILGRYPEEVPTNVLIRPESFASSVDVGRFWDVAGEAGLAYSDNAGGSVTDDFDNDGLIDIVVTSRDPCEPLRFYRNRGDGSFADAGEAAGLGNQFGGLNVTQVDYNNDGRLDLFVMRGGWETAIRNSLLRNRLTSEGVVFEDVTAEVGLGGPAHRTHTAAWADYDGDGWLDVFLGHEMSFSQLFRNRGDGTFEDTTIPAGMYFRTLTKGATWGDVNSDGRPDLYVSNFGDRNLLFVNRGEGRFEEVGTQWGVDEPTYSFATWFWDYDNDGWQDLAVVTFLQTMDEVVREYLGQSPQGETLRIYHNRGNGSFEDMTDSLGMSRFIPAMGANYGDLNNDGFLDFYLGTGAPSYGMLVPNRMFLNQGGQSFVDVTTSTGTGHLQKGHGISFADLDNDGDQDIFSNMGGAFPGDKYPSALFENPGHGNDWVAIKLVGRTSNRAAIGARLRVIIENGGEEKQVVRWVTSGGSFGASPLMQHIGLGQDAQIKKIEIDWPNGQPRQTLLNVPTNRFIVVSEGAENYQLATRSEFTFGSGATGGEHQAH